MISSAMVRRLTLVLVVMALSILVVVLWAWTRFSTPSIATGAATGSAAAMSNSRGPTFHSGQTPARCWTPSIRRSPHRHPPCRGRHGAGQKAAGRAGGEAVAPSCSQDRRHP